MGGLRGKPRNQQPHGNERAAPSTAPLPSSVSRYPQGSSVRVQMRNEEGQTVIDFKSIPIGQVSTLIEALLDRLDAVREVMEEEVEEQEQVT